MSLSFLPTCFVNAWTQWDTASPQEAVVKEGCPVLSQFPEGFLGKLRIRKSGKVELKLGDIVMDVCEGAAFSFLQVLWLF